MSGFLCLQPTRIFAFLLLWYNLLSAAGEESVELDSGLWYRRSGTDRVNISIILLQNFYFIIFEFEPHLYVLGAQVCFVLFHAIVEKGLLKDSL